MADDLGLAFWRNAGASAKASGIPRDANPFLLSNPSSWSKRLPAEVLAACATAWGQGWDAGEQRGDALSN